MFDKLSANIVEAERVVVRSSDGSSIELGVLNYGAENCSAALMLRDAAGANRAVLRLFEGAPRLEMSGADGELVFDLWAGRNGFSGLRFIQSKSPKVSIVSHAEEGAAAFFVHKNGRVTAFPNQK